MLMRWLILRGGTKMLEKNVPGLKTCQNKLDSDLYLLAVG